MSFLGRLPVVLLVLAGALGLTACANYRLGTGTKLAFTTLYVAPATSDVLLPQARALVTTQVRDAFIRDGRITLVDSPDAADATLHLTLTSYGRDVAVVRPEDVGLARRLDLNLTASATLTDNRTKQPLFDKRKLTVSRGVLVDGGQLQAEYQTLPLLAAKLADDTVHAVLDTW